MRGRVNEASFWKLWDLLKGLQMEVGQLLGIKTNRRNFEYYRVAENLLSFGAYVRNWVN
jgi:hypothetical protein